MISGKGLSYVIFSALYAPHAGGVETYTAGLADELARRGCRVTVATSRLSAKDPERETQENGVEVLRLPCWALMNARLPVPRKSAAFAQIMRELEARGFDRAIVNARFYGLSLAGARFARRTRTPAVIVEHGSAHLSLGNTVLDRVVEAYEHRATKRIAACGLPFVAVSQAASEWLGHFGLACAGLAPNALDAEAYAQEASTRAFRNELGIPSDALLVSFVGRFVPEKGVDALLKAADIVCAQRGGVGGKSGGHGNAFAFAFAGTGPLEAEVRRAAEALPVFALGRLDASDVAALLRDSDALCLPSRSEGFATVLLEAAAMGCVPIVTDVGGARELGVSAEEDASTGILLTDAHAETIAQSLRWTREHAQESHARSAKLALNVRARHGWGRTVDAFERVFSQLPKEGE